MYHISTRNLGNTIIFQPRPLDDATYTTPCICVAPTIPQCLAAIPTGNLIENRKGLWVYHTYEKGASCRWTKQIYDFCVTHEKRFYKPVEFHLHMHIDRFYCEWIHEVKIGLEQLTDLQTISYEEMGKLFIPSVEKIFTW